MADKIASTKNPILTGLALGCLGGAAIDVTILLAHGPVVLITYSVLVIAIIAILRVTNWPAFSHRFTASFLTFIVAAIIKFFIISVIWRIAPIIVIGGILSLAIAYLVDIGIEREAQKAT